MIKEHMKLLGYEVQDIVSGMKGTVDSVCFDLYGCVQASIRPPYDNKKHEHPAGTWCDVKRLKVLSKKPVMTPPDFDSPEIGAASKPLRSA